MGCAIAQVILASVMLSAVGSAILYGGGVFGILVSCMGSWRVHTYLGELRVRVVVGQSFLVCTSSYGVNFKASLRGK